MGAPGSGKGTQSQVIAEQYGIPHISTGEMLRVAKEQDNERGLTIRTLIDAGKFVPDDMIIEIVKERLSMSDCQNGYILDGFPRTVPQAQAMLDANIPVEHVLEIQVDDSLLVERITGRLNHPSSGRVYHVKFNPPAVEGKDDVTGEELVQRDDDKEEIVVERLKTYHNKTKPVLDFYKPLEDSHGIKYHVIEGTGEVEDISNQIFVALL